MNLKYRIEALLFSSGRRMSVEEIARLCNKSQNEVLSALQELKGWYEQKNSSLMVVEEGNFWKITVKEEHLPIVKKIVTETELSKTLMETLAVIAFKYPIKQSELVKIRTNKAYDHLKELEEMGYITRQKYSRTKIIKLTQKFFDYFSLPEEELKDKFKDFESIAKAIEEKESEVERAKKEEKKKAEEEKRKSEVRAKEVDLVDEEGHKTRLEVVDEKPLPEEQPNIVEEKESIGKLEVFEEPKGAVEEDAIGEGYEEKEAKTVGEELEAKPEEEITEEAKGSEGISEVDKRVEELLHPEKVDEEETEEEPLPEEGQKEKSEEKETTEEEQDEESEEKVKEEMQLKEKEEKKEEKEYYY